MDTQDIHGIMELNHAIQELLISVAHGKTGAVKNSS